MLPSKMIDKPLEFIPSLCRDLPLAKRVHFLTVSARESIDQDGMTRVLPGKTLLQSYQVYEAEDGVELVKEGLLPVLLPTRKITIVSWEKEPLEMQPFATLTWVILEDDTGRKKKVSELTQGIIEPGIFKFLQVSAVNTVLNLGERK